jgi:hypothetical protein
MIKKSNPFFVVVVSEMSALRVGFTRGLSIEAAAV